MKQINNDFGVVYCVEIVYYVYIINWKTNVMVDFDENKCLNFFWYCLFKPHVKKEKKNLIFFLIYV